MVNEAKQILAIFGGSFDPPHKGHQKIVERAVSELNIDKLLVVPAYLNPFKHSSSFLPEQRLKLCHTLFDNIEKVCVSDYEICEGKSVRTSQSIRHFNLKYNVKYLIIGSDNLEFLTTWHEFTWLNENITWIIATRDGYELRTDMLNSWLILTINEEANSTDIRKHKKLNYIDKKIEQSVKKTLKGINNDN